VTDNFAAREAERVARIKAYAKALADAAPRLSAEQLDRLAVIIRSTDYR
jgi:hypothetical protein